MTRSPVLRAVEGLRTLRDRAGRGGPLEHVRWAAIPLTLIVAILLGSLLAPLNVHLAPLLVAAPVSTAALAGPWATGAMAVLAVGAGAAVDAHDGLLHSPILPIHALAVLVVATFVTCFRSLHDRDRAELAQVRAVSEAAQRVVLRPIPPQLGPVRLASVYRSAAAHAQIGGDLYAASRTADGTRLIIGDVRGKGLRAIDDAAALLGAFHEAAHHHPTLAELAASLEESIQRHLRQTSPADDEYGERFITALLVEVPDHHPVVHLVSLGHPPPVRLSGDRSAHLRVARPSPPLGLLLGLGGTGPDDYRQETFGLGQGDTLLLYTDGVPEARDSEGGFYPLCDRVAAWPSAGPEQLLQLILGDLADHVDGCLDDDVAMVAVQRAARLPEQAGAAVQARTGGPASASAVAD